MQKRKEKYLKELKNLNIKEIKSKIEYIDENYVIVKAFISLEKDDRDINILSYGEAKRTRENAVRLAETRALLRALEIAFHV